MTVKNLRDQESLQEMKLHVESLLEKNNCSPNRPLNDGNALLSYKHYIENVAKSLATGQGTKFQAMQSVLKSLNPVKPGGGKLWDPTAAFGPPPGAEGYKTDLLDVPMASDNPGSRNALREDRLKRMAEGTYTDATTFRPGFRYPDGKTIIQKNKDLNLYDDEHPFSKGSYIDTDQPENLGVNGMKRTDKIPGVSVDIPDYASIFEKKDHGPDFGTGERGHNFFSPKKERYRSSDSSFLQKTNALNNMDAFFHQKDVDLGYVETSDIEEMNALFGDDDLYVPFYIEDLRRPDRRIYLRAFLKNLRESINPEWNTETFYGRVDPIATYRGTSRSFNLTFTMAAMSPQGFTAMWRKINNITKMMYPQSKNGILAKAPMLRLKIGDIFCDSSGNGITGFISSALEFDYTDMPWEISRFNGPSNIGVEIGKAPQIVNVSFTYQIIHENNPMIDENYNILNNFRQIGSIDLGAAGDELTITEEDIAEDRFNNTFNDLLESFDSTHSGVNSDGSEP